MKKLFVVLFLFSSLFFTSCNSKNDEIKIGFVVGLSGKYSSLGTNIRDGFLLAFDEIDNKIDNKKVKIIQYDDKQDKNEAKKAIEYFIKNDIKLVVGNSTSSMTKISIPIISKQKDMLLISPTASSSEFSKIDDNFLRIQVDSTPNKYEEISQHLVKNNHKNIFLIYDSKNKSYAKDYQNMFQDMFIQKGGNKFVGQVDLNLPYNQILEKLEKTKNDMILVVGNSIDSAKIIQYLRINNVKSKIHCSGWAKTLDFIDNGGKAVEGVIFFTAYDDTSLNKKYLTFVKKYKKMYGKLPSVFAVQGYELGQILIKQLKISADISKLKNSILSKKTFNGLQGDITFDKYGDISRDYFLMEVKNSKFVRLR